MQLVHQPCPTGDPGLVYDIRVQAVAQYLNYDAAEVQCRFQIVWIRVDRWVMVVQDWRSTGNLPFRFFNRSLSSKKVLDESACSPVDSVTRFKSRKLRVRHITEVALRSSHSLSFVSTILFARKPTYRELYYTSFVYSDFRIFIIFSTLDAI